MKTDFDENIGNVHTVPKDIGRVLLNLYNNTFYAVNEKKKNVPDNYDPTISVSTIKSANKEEICIKDAIAKALVGGS